MWRSWGGPGECRNAKRRNRDWFQISEMEGSRNLFHPFSAYVLSTLSILLEK